MSSKLSRGPLPGSPSSPRSPRRSARGGARLRASRSSARSRARGRARPRHPVHRAQLVDDRALDPRDRVCLELHVPVRVVALDRADQPEQAVGRQVVLVDVRGQTARDPPGDELHERRVGEDQPVTDGRVARLAIRPPERLNIVRHAERIRRRAMLSHFGRLPRAPGPHDEPRHPCRKHACGHRDHPLIGLGCLPRNARENRRQEEEKRPKRSPVRRRAHGRNLPRSGSTLAGQPSVVAEGRSSIGRAPVSKTGGCRFESCRPCPFVGPESGMNKGFAGHRARGPTYR